MKDSKIAFRAEAGQSAASGTGPFAAFLLPAAAALGLVVLSPVLLAPGHVAQDALLPVGAVLLFAAAAMAALIAFRRHPAQTRLTYWDTAGALVLLGIALSALIEPDQMVRLVRGEHR
ncbi:MAG: hypothetical protein AB7K04_14570 [Pseudorhodoplanes sp.]